MQLPAYPYKTNDSCLDYEFMSEGPKGTIKKIIRFIKIEKDVFIIGFGDLDKKTGVINDITVTDNKDSRKILATVVSTMHDFILQFPDAMIGAKGTTLSRTRLYRMGITSQWKEISIDFEVYGLRNKNWEPFELSIEYEAFLLRKNNL